jgi:hypothetical protein
MCHRISFLLKEKKKISFLLKEKNIHTQKTGLSQFPRLQYFIAFLVNTAKYMNLKVTETEKKAQRGPPPGERRSEVEAPNSIEN